MFSFLSFPSKHKHEREAKKKNKTVDNYNLQKCLVNGSSEHWVQVKFINRFVIRTYLILSFLGSIGEHPKQTKNHCRAIDRNICILNVHTHINSHTMNEVENQTQEMILKNKREKRFYRWNEKQTWHTNMTPHTIYYRSWGFIVKNSAVYGWESERDWDKDGNTYHTFQSISYLTFDFGCKPWTFLQLKCLIRRWKEIPQYIYTCSPTAFEIINEFRINYDKHIRIYIQMYFRGIFLTDIFLMNKISKCIYRLTESTKRKSDCDNSVQTCANE